MPKIKVGYQGDAGSNSNMAALSFMKGKDAQFLPLISSLNVISNLRKGKIDLGVVAVRNSTAGVVAETKEALLGLSYEIISELELPIHHVLYKKKDDFSNPNRIISHPQALLQTKKYRSLNYPGVSEMEYPDTALAARKLAEGAFHPGTYVIAPPLVKDLYSLDVVDESIEDMKDNRTLFYLIRIRY